MKDHTKNSKKHSASGAIAEYKCERESACNCSPLPQLVDTKAVSRMTGISEKTLRKWRCTKAIKLAYVKIGAKVLYDVEDINTYIRENKHLPHSSTL